MKSSLDRGTWREKLPLLLEDFVDSFVVAGATQDEVLVAIVDEVGILREAHSRDPDPAEDCAVDSEVGEPSNDWPSADGK